MNTNSEENGRGMTTRGFNDGADSDQQTVEMPGSNPIDSGAESPDRPDRGGMDSDRARKVLEKGASRVRKEDVEKLQTTLKEKIRGLKDLEDGLFWIGTLVGRAKLLWSMIRDREFDVSMGTVLMVAAGLIYFVVPVDLTPDFIPGFGYIDDAVVLSTLWTMVQGELERYIMFLKNSGRDIDDLDALAFADGPPSEQGEVDLASFEKAQSEDQNGHSDRAHASA